MTERPILFTAFMVRALLDGSKTQTRRAFRNQPNDEWQPAHYVDLHAYDKHGELTNRVTGWGVCNDDGDQGYSCPYGQPGDRLWVRETWANVGTSDPGLTVYRADYPACVPCGYENVPPPHAITWKPSIHMFRKDSRITLEVTGVRVERLQDISADDAFNEGIKITLDSKTKTPLMRVSGKYPPAQYIDGFGLAIAEYASLWESINGPGSWAANPWVWVIEFKVIK